MQIIIYEIIATLKKYNKKRPPGAATPSGLRHKFPTKATKLLYKGEFATIIIASSPQKINTER